MSLSHTTHTHFLHKSQSYSLVLALLPSIFSSMATQARIVLCWISNAHSIVTHHLLHHSPYSPSFSPNEFPIFSKLFWLHIKNKKQNLSISRLSVNIGHIHQATPWFLACVSERGRASVSFIAPIFTQRNSLLLLYSFEWWHPLLP